MKNRKIVSTWGPYNSATRGLKYRFDSVRVTQASDESNFWFGPVPYPYNLFS